MEELQGERETKVSTALHSTPHTPHLHARRLVPPADLGPPCPLLVLLCALVRYNNLANEDKQRYEREMEEYRAGEREKEDKRKAKKKSKSKKEKSKKKKKKHQQPESSSDESNDSDSESDSSGSSDSD